MIESILIVVTSTYVLVFGWFWLKWPKPRLRHSVENNLPSVEITVLIPARNEETGILFLLKDLARQSYSRDAFEVIVLDDNSHDSTRDLVERYQEKAPYPLRLVSLPIKSGFRGSTKKMAITKGADLATGKWIMCTDGDCRVSPNWISSFASYFARSDIDFVSGPVRMMAKAGWWSRFQSLEFASLIGVGASTLDQGFPTICNGANMAFRSRTFQTVCGFQGFEQIISGDDQILLQKITKTTPDAAAFNFCQDSVVTTETSKGLQEFIQQRVRWAGKWKHTSSFNLRALGIFVFGFYFLLTLSLGWIVIFGGNLAIFAIVFAKLLIDYLFLKKVTRMLRQRLLLGHFLLSELIYPFYALFFGTYSQLSKFIGKGREFSHEVDEPSERPTVSYPEK